MKVSVIIPVLNEEPAVRDKLPTLQWLRDAGHELIVVDGGSQDASRQLAEDYSNQLILSARGRAVQMNAGANVATGDILLFLHIDTELPPNAIDSMISSINGKDKAWGRFDVRLSGNHLMFRIIESMMNFRSWISGIATGDQAIFITRNLFEEIDGYSDIPLMEDIEISRRLKKIIRPVCLSDPVIVSSRRWENKGIFRTIWLMWCLRFFYWSGRDPDRIAQQYYR